MLSLHPLAGKSPFFMTIPLRKTHWQNVCDTFKWAQCQSTGLLPGTRSQTPFSAHTLTCLVGAAGRPLRLEGGRPWWRGRVNVCKGLGEGRERHSPVELQLTRLTFCAQALEFPFLS